MNNNIKFINILKREGYINEVLYKYFINNIEIVNRFNLYKINRTLVKDCCYCPFNDYCMICDGIVGVIEYIIDGNLTNNKEYWWNR